MNLSDSELEVLRRVASGLTRKEIASDLECTEPAIQFRLKRIREKLGSVNCAHSVVMALKGGMLSLEELPMERR